MEVFAFDGIDLLIVVSLVVLLLIQLFYYSRVYWRIPAYNKKINKGKVEFTEERLPLSVVVYGQGETEAIAKYLPLVLEQDYPEFEVILVNDELTEQGQLLMNEFENKYPHFYHTHVPEGSHNISRKKLALTMGIKASKYDWLVFTDPDCYPESKEWLQMLARNFTPSTDIVLAYSGYEHRKGCAKRMIAFDNFFASLRYLGYALLGKPYMGIGRNMAYRKDLFFKNKGFSQYLNLRKGEDDLFINKVASPTNTRVETSVQSKVIYSPADIRKSWEEERLNKLVTSRLMKGKQRYWLGAETTTRIFFYLSFIALLVKALVYKHWAVVGVAAILFLIRLLVQLIILNKAGKVLGEPRVYLSLPVTDLLLPVHSLRFKISCMFKDRWHFMSK